jgi:hypothetical protein
MAKPQVDRQWLVVCDLIRSRVRHAATAFVHYDLYEAAANAVYILRLLHVRSSLPQLNIDLDRASSFRRHYTFQPVRRHIEPASTSCQLTSSTPSLSPTFASTTTKAQDGEHIRSRAAFDA